MIKELVHDPIFLALKSEPATAADLQTAQYMIMLNPEIIKRSDPYETEESCLSLLGGPRKIKRYKKIRVQYQTLDFKIRTKTFEGWTAQIVQHEIDHCNGVLI